MTSNPSHAIITPTTPPIGRATYGRPRGTPTGRPPPITVRNAATCRSSTTEHRSPLNPSPHETPACDQPRPRHARRPAASIHHPLTSFTLDITGERNHPHLARFRTSILPIKQHLPSSSGQTIAPCASRRPPHDPPSAISPVASRRVEPQNLAPRPTPPTSAHSSFVDHASSPRRSYEIPPLLTNPAVALPSSCFPPMAARQPTSNAPPAGWPARVDRRSRTPCRSPCSLLPSTLSHRAPPRTPTLTSIARRHTRLFASSLFILPLQFRLHIRLPPSPGADTAEPHHTADADNIILTPAVAPFLLHPANTPYYLRPYVDLHHHLEVPSPTIDCTTWATSPIIPLGVAPSSTASP